MGSFLIPEPRQGRKNAAYCLEHLTHRVSQICRPCRGFVPLDALKPTAHAVGYPYYAPAGALEGVRRQRREDMPCRVGKDHPLCYMRMISRCCGPRPPHDSAVPQGRKMVDPGASASARPGCRGRSRNPQPRQGRKNCDERRVTCPRRCTGFSFAPTGALSVGCTATHGSRRFRMRRLTHKPRFLFATNFSWWLGSLGYSCQPASAGLFNSSRSPAKAG